MKDKTLFSVKIINGMIATEQDLEGRREFEGLAAAIASLLYDSDALMAITSGILNHLYTDKEFVKKFEKGITRIPDFDKYLKHYNGNG